MGVSKCVFNSNAQSRFVSAVWSGWEEGMVNVVLLLTFRAPLLGFLDHLEGRIWISKTISLGYEKKSAK